MIARVAALALGLVSMLLPGPAGTAGEAEAVCVREPVSGQCLPVCEAAAVYEEVRRSNEAARKLLPGVACLMAG